MSQISPQYCDGLEQRIKELSAENAALREQLAKFQESEFNPDWSMLEATRESLREHMGMNKALANENERLRKQLAAAQKDIAALNKATYPFAKIVNETFGRIPTERLSFADWHELTKAHNNCNVQPDAAIEKEKAE